MKIPILQAPKINIICVLSSCKSAIIIIFYIKIHFTSKAVVDDEGSAE